MKHDKNLEDLKKLKVMYADLLDLANTLYAAFNVAYAQSEERRQRIQELEAKLLQLALKA